MAITLSFSAPVDSVARTGNGVEGYSICYPFYGSYSGGGTAPPAPTFTAIYHPNADAPSSDTVLGQFGDLTSAQTACQQHCNGLYP